MQKVAASLAFLFLFLVPILANAENFNRRRVMKDITCKFLTIKDAVPMNTFAQKAIESGSCPSEIFVNLEGIGMTGERINYYSFEITQHYEDLNNHDIGCGYQNKTTIIFSQNRALPQGQHILPPGSILCSQLEVAIWP